MGSHSPTYPWVTEWDVECFVNGGVGLFLVNSPMHKMCHKVLTFWPEWRTVSYSHAINHKSVLLHIAVIESGKIHSTSKYLCSFLKTPIDFIIHNFICFCICSNTSEKLTISFIWQALKWCRLTNIKWKEVSGMLLVHIPYHMLQKLLLYRQ